MARSITARATGNCRLVLEKQFEAFNKLVGEANERVPTTLCQTRSSGIYVLLGTIEIEMKKYTAFKNL